MSEITQSISGITAPPDPATDTGDTYSDKAAITMTEIKTMGDELEVFRGQVNTVAGEVNVNAGIASDSATAAEGSAATASATANYAGPYSSLSGAKVAGISADHLGAFWMLLENVADVTLEVPGTSAKWARTYGAGQIEERASNVLLTAVDNGKIIKVTSGTFTQTIDTAANCGPNWSITYYNAGTGTITLDPDASELIDGATTKTLKSGQIAFISCTGTEFKTIVTSESTGDHFVTVTTGNGHGSTNNKIRRFTTTQASGGTDVTYADSAANGAAFTIVRGGLYSIYYLDTTSSGSGYGLSLNSAELTTAAASITAASRLAYVGVATSISVPCSVTVRLVAGDIIRPHTGGAFDSNTALLSVFSIRKVGV